MLSRFALMRTGASRVTLPLRQLTRSRWGVRGALALGVTASVTANILHARANPISEIIAGWPPLALLITIELIARVPTHTFWLAVVRMLATTGIAGIAAWVSYWHMAAVASRYGETTISAYLLPLSVDGLVIVGSVCLVELTGRIRTMTNAPIGAPAPPPAIEVAASEPAAATATAATVADDEPKRAERQEVATVRNLATVGKLPAEDKRRDEACRLVLQGMTPREIHQLWGSPESPKVGTIRWWTADIRGSVSRDA